MVNLSDSLSVDISSNLIPAKSVYAVFCSLHKILFNIKWI